MPGTHDDDNNDSFGSSTEDSHDTDDRNNTSKKFDHNFEGWSVWLEPCPNEAGEIINEMKKLSSCCGGPEQGTDLFALHCTVLYNFSPRNLDRGYSRKRKNVGEDHGVICSDKELGQKMLQKCIDVFYSSASSSSSASSKVERETAENATSRKEAASAAPPKSVELNPTDFYFFPYPKEADDGRGFGCVISMLLLENNDNLQRLHGIVADIFPPDERHGSHNSSNDDEDSKKEEETDDNESSSLGTNENRNRGKRKNKFIPHMALVYAPEMYHKSLDANTEQMKITKEHFLKKPLRAKFLSLWSTQGKLKDWNLISRIDLL